VPVSTDRFKEIVVEFAHLIMEQGK
jgi:hypothetical protein